MDGSRRGAWFGRGSLLTLAILFAGASTAEAARIRTARVPFAEFLRAGPDLWGVASTTIPRGLPLRLDGQGSPLSSLFRDYILYRRGIDPARFDAHHPRLARPIARFALANPPAATTPVDPSRQVVIPRTPVTPPSQQTVPEPSTLVIAAGLLVGTAALRRRRSPFSPAEATA